MEKILGGGWVCLPNGTVIYIPDGEEEGDDDNIIFG